MKQFIFALSIFLLILSWVGIGYLIDWVLFDLPSDNEIQPMIDQNRTATKYEEVKSEIKSPSYDTSESENTSDGNHSNEDDEIELGGNSVDDSSDVNQMIECISSNNSSNPASSETKKDDWGDHKCLSNVLKIMIFDNNVTDKYFLIFWNNFYGF